MRYGPLVPDVQVERTRAADSDVPRSSYTVAAVVPAAQAEAFRVWDTDKTCLLARPNTLLLSPDGSGWQRDDLNLRAANGEGRKLVLLDGEIDHFLRAGGCIADMYLTQPPATSVAVTISVWNAAFAPARLETRFFEVVRRGEGVRHGDVMAVVEGVEFGERYRLEDVHVDFEGPVFASKGDGEEAGRQAWLHGAMEAARYWER